MARSPDVMNTPAYKRLGTSGLDEDDGGIAYDDKRDVMGYIPPTRVMVNDPKSPGLHGDNCTNRGSQGYGYEKKQSSGGPGIGGDSIRMAGSQGRR